MNKVREGYKITEVGEIPEEWEVSKLEGVTEKLTDGSHFSPEPTEFSDYKICTVANMLNNTLDLVKSVCISEEDYCNLCKSGCKPETNDVLLSKDGTVGKTLVYMYEDYKIVLLSSIAIIRPKKQIVDSFYLKHYISYPKTLQQLINMKTGSAIKRIVLRDIKGLKLPIPTLKEQQKISLILSSVDEKIENADNIIEKTKELKKGLMQKLLTKGIGYDRFKETEIGMIPEEWKVENLGNVTEIVRGASPRPKGDSRYYGGNIPRLMISDVTRDGKYVTPKTDFLTEEGAKKSRPMNKGDLVISVSGTVALPTFLVVDSCIHDGFMGFKKINEKLNKDFLYYQILFLREKLIRSATDGGIYVNLTTDIVKAFSIIIPSLQEQKQIVSILSSVDEKIEKYEIEKEKLQDLKKGLMQKLLTGKIRVKV